MKLIAVVPKISIPLVHYFDCPWGSSYVHTDMYWENSGTNKTHALLTDRDPVRRLQQQHITNSNKRGRTDQDFRNGLTLDLSLQKDRTDTVSGTAYGAPCCALRWSSSGESLIASLTSSYTIRLSHTAGIEVPFGPSMLESMGIE